MSINSHLEELKRKHTTLSHAVEMAQRSPASDDMEVVGMKKKKLQLLMSFQSRTRYLVDVTDIQRTV